MALINRISRLFRADLHAVLDRIEEPGPLLKQAVREMEESIGDDEKRMKILLHEQSQIAARQSDIQHTLSNLEHELDICFKSQKDELARSLIKRKLESQRFYKFLERKHGVLGNTLTELRQRLDENQKRLVAMQQKLELFTPDTPSLGMPEYAHGPELHVSDDEVEVALLREKQQRQSP